MAGAALVIGAQAAGAADLPPIIQEAPPVPVAEFGGWYLRGDIGFSNQRVRDVIFVDSGGTVPAARIQQKIRVEPLIRSGDQIPHKDIARAVGVADGQVGRKTFKRDETTIGAH